MDLLQQIVARAKANKQRIVLPEAEEERTLKAADRVLADDLADLLLIGNPDNIKKRAAEWGLQNIDKATIINVVRQNTVISLQLTLLFCFMEHDALLVSLSTRNYLL